MYHEKWRALGSEAVVFLADADEESGRAQANKIKDELSAFEERFSRFLPTSELSRLNAAGGKEFTARPHTKQSCGVGASAEMIAILLAARELHRETGGVFDLLILPQLERAGYIKSFDDPEVRFSSNLEAELPNERHSFSEIEIDKEHSVIRLPRGAKIDLGGIGKGYAADLIAAELEKKFRNFWISLGGDIRFGGDFNGGPWTVGVQDPFAHEKDLFDLEVSGEFRATATSGTTKRRFQEVNGNFSHHIIDPRTGRPSSSGIVAATVIADSAARADVLAKSALILGAKNGIELMNKLPRAECLLIDKNGKHYFSDDLRTLIRPPKQ